MSKLTRYRYFKVEINQYDIIWSQKHIVKVLKVNEVEIFQYCKCNDT